MSVSWWFGARWFGFGFEAPGGVDLRNRPSEPLQTKRSPVKQAQKGYPQKDKPSNLQMVPFEPIRKGLQLIGTLARLWVWRRPWSPCTSRGWTSPPRACGAATSQRVSALACPQARIDRAEKEKSHGVLADCSCFQADISWRKSLESGDLINLYPCSNEPQQSMTQE